jgi:aryl-alcohol dehydrogenase-like predicted oxidoreductase
MHYVPLGDTGVTVSAVCLGTDYYGSRTPSTTAYQLLDQFAEAGGTFIDTSNIYAFWIPGYQGGESETTIGDWMAARQNRAQMFVGTKIGFPYPGTTGGLRANEIERECERSLRRLKINTIDLYYAHCDDRQTSLEEILEAFHHLVQAGKVRFIGASNWLTWRLAEARLISDTHGWARHAAFEFRHTYLRPKPGMDFAPQVVTNEQLLDYCRAYNVTLLAYSILLNGAYTRPDRSLPTEYLGPDSQARLAALQAVARETEASPNQVVIAWMRHSNPSILPIIGGSTQEQLTENLHALTLELTAEQMMRLDEAGT